MRFSGFLALLLFLFIVPGAIAQTYDVYYVLSVQSSSISPSTVYPGGEVNVTVTVKNNSYSAAAEDVNFTLLLSEGMSPVKTSSFEERIESKAQKTLLFSLKTGESIRSGTYKLSLRMEYYRDGKLVTQTEYIDLAVSDIQRLNVRDVSLSDYSPHQGDVVTVRAFIENAGSLEARNVTSEISKVSSSDFGNFIVLSDAVQSLGSISPADSREVLFQLMPTEKVTPGVYSFQLDANCLDCGLREIEKFSFRVFGRPEPIFSGIDYSVTGSTVKKIFQGSMFSLSVQLDNIGEEKAKAVEVIIETDESLVGAKESYVGNIDEDDSGTALFDLQVLADAQPGDHQIKIVVEYLDEFDSKQLMENEFSVYVNEVPPESPIGLLVLVIIILVILYFLIKMVFRQLAMRKM